MSYKPVDEKTVGLYYKNNSIQAAYVILEKGTPVVKKLIDVPLVETNEGLVKPLYIDQDEKELQDLASAHLAVVALNESDVLVRRLRLKLTKEKDIEEAFLFQTEPQLPYPLENAVVDKITVEKGEESTLIVFFSAKKDYVQKSLSFWQERGIDPEVISAEPVALNALLNSCCPPTPLQFAVHIGKTATLCVLIKEGKLLASHSVSIGWNTLYNALTLDTPQELPEIAEIFSESFNALGSEQPHIKKAVDELLQMILWNYLSLIKETKVKETPLLYVVGEGANIPHLASLIETSLGITQGELNSFNETRENLNNFALPIGLSLTAQPKDQSLAINFRKQEFSYATPWKRFKKPLLTYAALALGTAFSLYFFGSSYLKYKEDHLKTNFLNLLSFTQKPYDVFESLYEQKFPQEKKSDSIQTIGELTASDISNRLNFLENDIKAIPDTFPLLPNIPKVSDVLVWLSTHPLLVCKDNLNECPPFNIDLFNYTLVKRPEITKKNEKYQVKIDLEFSTSSPRLAREFHDALITPNDFVDPKGEIKWTATKGKYRTSFYLKDKTAYP